jgi:O-antigen/teichoic acid export membrane protein
MSRIVNNIFTFTIINGLNKAIPFLLLPIIVKLLDKNELGLLAAFQSYYDLVIILVGTSSGIFIQQKYFKVSKNELISYVSNLYAYHIFSSIFFILNIYIFKSMLVNLFQVNVSVIYWGVIMAILFQGINITYSYLQMQRRTVTYGLFIIVQTIINLTISLLMLHLGHGWISRVYGISVALTVSYLGTYMYMYYHKHTSPSMISQERIKEIFSKSISFFPTELIGWGKRNINKLLILSVIGASALGEYYLALTIASIISLLVSSIVQGLRPYLLADLSKNRYRKITKYVSIVISFSILLVILMTLAKPTMTHYIFSSKLTMEYPLYIGILLMVSLEPLIKLLLTILLYFEKNGRISKLALITNSVFIVTSFPLLKLYGIFGLVINSIVLSLVIITAYSIEINKEIIARKLS